jgi:hypothetical protein
MTGNNLRRMKLNSVFSKLGLSYLECIRLISFDENVDVACWIYNQANQEEMIHLNPLIIDNYTPEVLEMVLRHEILHRAFYNAFKYQFENKTLSNIVLDIVINKILHTAYGDYSEPMFKLYPKESLKSAVVLCIADVPPNTIQNDKIRALYKEIWISKDIPNPESLYYQLIDLNRELPELKDPFRTLKNPFRPPQVNRCGIAYKEWRPSLVDELNERLEQSIVDEVDNKIKYYDRAKVLKNYYIDLNKFDPNPLKDFVRNIKQLRKLSKVVNNVKEDLTQGTRLQVYPMFLSRLGIIYNAMGLNDVLPLYWNNSTNTISGNKYKIALYVDLSGSMKDYLGYIRWIVKQLDGFPFSPGHNNNSCYGFNTLVYDISLNDIAEGNFRGGGETDFNAPISHFLALSDSSNVGLMFTDGLSSITEATKEDFKKKRKLLLYTIYFSKSNTKIKSALDEISQKTFTIFISN